MAAKKERQRSKMGLRKDLDQEACDRLRALPLHAPMTTKETAAWCRVGMDRVTMAIKCGALRCVDVEGFGVAPQHRVFVEWARDWLMRGATNRIDGVCAASGESSDLDLTTRARAILGDSG